MSQAPGGRLRNLAADMGAVMLGALVGCKAPLLPVTGFLSASYCWKRLAHSSHVELEVGC